MTAIPTTENPLKEYAEGYPKEVSVSDARRRSAGMDSLSNVVPPPARKMRQSRTAWVICRQDDDGLTRFYGFADKDPICPEFRDLRECEQVCAGLAKEDVGATFVPVKIGKAFTAQKIERVEIVRE